jgi:hypothetical protein
MSPPTPSKTSQDAVSELGDTLQAVNDADYLLRATHGNRMSTDLILIMKHHEQKHEKLTIF